MIQTIKERFNIHSVLKGAATVMMLAAACMISVSPFMAAESTIPYFLFLSTHAIWTGYALIQKEYSLLWMNVGLFPFDFYAIGIRL